MYCGVADIANTGVAPVTGTVTPEIDCRLMVMGIPPPPTASVSGNIAATTPELALLAAIIAPETVKKFEGTPSRV